MDSVFPYVLDAVVFAGIIVSTIVLAALFRWTFNKLIQRSTRDINNDPTYYKFFKHAVTALIIVVGFSMAFYRIESLKTLAGSLLAGAGILAVAVGFASQHALSNIISGIFIVIFRPFRVNDILRIRDIMAGTVEDITLRHTIIKDFQNHRIIIPNSIISDEVIINSTITDERVCRHIEIGIAYDADIDKAKTIFREEVLNHPLHIDGRNEEQIEKGIDEVIVRVIALGDFAVTIRAWAWANNPPESFQMFCEVIESVKKRFDREGIEIPFPYRTLVYKKDLQNT